MLLFEVVVTRLFSVLFFYHFSFFAISLVMSGLVVGGIVVSRWNAAALSERSFAMRLAVLSAVFSAATGAAVVGLVRTAELDTSQTPSLMGVAVYALLFLPGLVAAGAFLALAFARDQRWIGRILCGGSGGRVVRVHCSHRRASITRRSCRRCRRRGLGGAGYGIHCAVARDPLGGRWADSGFSGVAVGQLLERRRAAAHQNRRRKTHTGALERTQPRPRFRRHQDPLSGDRSFSRNVHAAHPATRATGAVVGRGPNMSSTVPVVRCGARHHRSRRRRRPVAAARSAIRTRQARQEEAGGRSRCSAGTRRAARRPGRLSVT